MRAAQRDPNQRMTATTQPLASHDGMIDLLSVAPLGFAVTGLPILLHLVDQRLGIAACCSGAALIAVKFERPAPIVLLVAFLFQNMFVAMSSTQVAQYSDLDSIKAYNFIATATIWIILCARFLLNLRSASNFLIRMFFMTSVIGAIVGVFFVCGLTVDFRGSVIYMRNLILPVMLFQICLFVSSRNEIRLVPAMALVLGILLACGYLELLFVERWLDLINGWTYWDLASTARRAAPGFEQSARETGIVATSVLDLLTTRFLNTDLFGLDLRVVRLQGPNLHPISFGYALAIIAAFCAAHGRVWLAAATLPLLLVVGAKGALAFLLFSTVFCMVARHNPGRLPPVILACVLAAFAILIFRNGLASGDFHVLGLIGGFTGFLHAPLGHSLGEGGNLSTNFAEIDWSKYQHAGATDIAVESAIGVLLYQLGLAAAPVLAIYLWLARTSWKLHASLRSPALALSAAAIPIAIVNGLFQEEALFAPLAFALVMFFVGMTFGAVDRKITGAIAVVRESQASFAPERAALA
jgi:hypothetical protein